MSTPRPEGALEIGQGWYAPTQHIEGPRGAATEGQRA